MKLNTLLVSALLASTTIVPAMAQADTDIVVVLSEELDLVEPCNGHPSNIGRVVMQNISETLTELGRARRCRTDAAPGR